MINYNKILALTCNVLLISKFHYAQDVNLNVSLNLKSVIEVKIVNNSHKDYFFQVDTSYIGIYEEEGKLWYEITDIYGNAVLKYNNMYGFRVFPSNELGQKWKRESEIKDSIHRSVAKFLNKSGGFTVGRKSLMYLNFKFAPDIYERQPEEARDEVLSYILRRGEKYKARVVYTPNLELRKKNKNVYAKKLFSNYFYFEY